MKIAIIHASAGSGHRTAAESVYEYLKERADCDVSLIDILAYVDTSFARIYSKGYFFLASHLQLLWYFLFTCARFKLIKVAVNAFSRIYCKKFIKHLIDERFDVVVVTHFFPAEVVSFLRSKKKINSKLITVITDFGVHPLWVYKECHAYVVASEFTALELTKMNVPLDKVKVFGIPIRAGFVSSAPKSKELRAILLVTGSFGLLSIESIVDLIPEDISLTVVCGNNRQLFERLKPKADTRLQVFGFTDLMPQLMAGADLMITKPGGASIAEALAMDLPMVFVQGIPGQETVNAEVLRVYGAALRACCDKEVIAIIEDLKTHPEKLELMRNNIKNIKKPDASRKIGNYVCSSSAGTAG